MLLLLKIVLVPALVGSVTLAARRWGLLIGGLLTALPMSAGPTLCFYAIEQGNAFAASAGRAAMLGIAGTAAFCVAYARIALVSSWVPAVLAGWAAFALVAWATRGLPDLRGIGEMAIAVAALLAATHLMPSRGVVAASGRAPRLDLPLRMLAAATTVVVLTALAARLGPRLSGILSAFPVVTMILGVFTHVQRGAGAVVGFYRGLLRGLHAFALFCLVFSMALGSLGWPLLIAVAAALAAQLALQGMFLFCMVRAGHGRR